MRPTLTIDTRGIEALLKELSRTSGRTYEHVLKDQTERILETAARYTHSATTTDIKARHQFRVDRAFNTWPNRKGGRQLPEISINSGRRGGDKGKVWLRDKSEDGGTKFFVMNRNKRWSNDRWGRYQALEEQRKQARDEEIKNGLKRAMASRGLQKRSWQDIADALGLRIKIPAYASRAVSRSGRRYVNGTGTIQRSGTALSYLLINSAPILITRMDGAKILQRAINTRLKAFQIETEKGVFNDLAARAKRYPGIYIRN